MERVFISDLHLEDERPDISRAFFALLKTLHGRVDELYLLGDIFEVWLGDDALTNTAKEAAKHLSALSQSGCSIYLMHGNRDFLMGAQFAEECAATIINEPFLITLNGESAVLMHGDTLCTEDKLYMDFRRLVRNPVWQQDFLSKSVDARIAFARKARNQSQEDSKEKSYEILDVTPSEVIRVMEENGVRLLIHGHTHRPDRHQLTTTLGESERIVLGDWHTQGWLLKSSPDELTLESFGFNEY